jgi:hypothetical protein
MPDKYDPDERFHLDAEPEDVFRKLFGDDQEDDGASTEEGSP